MSDKLKELKKKEKELVKKLEENRKLIGESDGAMQSKCPSGIFELENHIRLLEIQLESIRKVSGN